MHRSQRGQVAPLVAVVLVGAGFLCVVVARFGVAAMQRADARIAADAAALAGAAAGRGAADEIARANAARIIRYDVADSDVELRVKRAAAEATARARREGDREPRGAAPALRAVLARAAQLLGRKVPVTKVLDRGLAVEVREDVVGELARVAADAGLCQPDPGARPAYFDVCPPPESGSP